MFGMPVYAGSLRDLNFFNYFLRLYLLKCYANKNHKLYLSEGFGSLIRRDSAKFENKFLKTVKIDHVS